MAAASQLGMIGLGRRGRGMTERLREGGHEVQTYDPQVDERTAGSLEELKSQLDAPRAFWMMVPAGKVAAALREQFGGHAIRALEEARASADPR